MADAASLVRSVYEAFERGDLDNVTSVMADDLEWFEAEHNPFWSGAPIVGPRPSLMASSPASRKSSTTSESKSGD